MNFTFEWIWALIPLIGTIIAMSIYDKDTNGHSYEEEGYEDELDEGGIYEEDDYSDEELDYKEGFDDDEEEFDFNMGMLEEDPIIEIPVDEVLSKYVYEKNLADFKEELLKIKSLKDICLEATDEEGNIFAHKAYPACIAMGKTAFAQALFDAGESNINNLVDMKHSALHITCLEGLLLPSKRLIEAGIDINIKNYCGDNALCFAANSGNIDLVKLIVEKGADVNDKGENDNPVVFNSKTYEIANYLIIKGADVTQKNALNQTVFFNNQYVDNRIFRLYIKNGVNVNEKDDDGKIALHTETSLELATFLINNGADVNMQDDFGKTPLHYAVIDGNENLIDLLLEKGVDPNIRDNEIGNAPLHIACYDPISIPMAEKLIRGGADINIVNYDDQTPLYIALNFGAPEMVEFLKKYKALE